MYMRICNHKTAINIKLCITKQYRSQALFSNTTCNWAVNFETLKNPPSMPISKRYVSNIY